MKLRYSLPDNVLTSCVYSIPPVIILSISSFATSLGFDKGCQMVV